MPLSATSIGTLAGCLVAAAVAMAGCGGASSHATQSSSDKAVADRPPGPLSTGSFTVPGEVMVFSMSFRGIGGGEATVVTGEPGTIDGHRVVIMRSLLQSAGVVKWFKEIRDDVASWIDMATGAPIRYRADMIFGDKQAQVEGRFTRPGDRPCAAASRIAPSNSPSPATPGPDHATVRPAPSPASPPTSDDKNLLRVRSESGGAWSTHCAGGGQRIAVEYERQHRKNPGKTRRLSRRFTMPAGELAHDIHSALGAIRAWEPGPGEKAYFYALSSRTMWLNTITFVGRENLRTELGTYPTLRVDGIAARLTTRLQLNKRRKPRTYTLWLSDDANRLPLRVVGHTEYGDILIELTRYAQSDTQGTGRSL